MPAVSKRLQHIPSPPIKQDQSSMKQLQGIVTILPSDNNSDQKNNYKSAASIRRTLSADMSSKKWLQHNGFFSPTKKIDDKRPGQDDIWKAIQSEKERNGLQKPSAMDVWGSILTQKSDSGLISGSGSDILPPAPYVHPLVRRSASTLSEKSLEICTESLGSETGSDGVSSYPASEVSIDADDQEKQEDCLKASTNPDPNPNPFEDLHVAKYKESPARAFPPPLASIAGGDGAASLHMQSRRENGRLVLEAVSVPPRNFFHSQRRDGRLVLTLINTSESVEEVFDNVEDDTEEADDGGGDDGYEEEEEEDEVVKEKIEKVTKEVEFVSVQKTGVVMKKFIALRNKNRTWNNKPEEEPPLVAEAEEKEQIPVPQSLPPRPPVARLISSAQPPAAAASFNPYEYFWRNKTAVAAVSGGFINNPEPTSLKNSYNKNMVKEYENHHRHNQDLVLVRRNKTEFFVPYLRGCKEPKKSLLIWEPYCIATS